MNCIQLNLRQVNLLSLFTKIRRDIDKSVLMQQSFTTKANQFFIFDFASILNKYDESIERIDKVWGTKLHRFEIILIIFKNWYCLIINVIF